MKGTTKSGFQFEISEDVKDDYELLEDYAELATNQLVVTRLLTHLLGKEQKAALMEHCRTESGRVSTEQMMTEVFEITESLNDLKKS